MSRPPLDSPALLSATKSRLLALAVAIFSVDQWTKLWAERAIDPHLVLEIVPGFANLVLARNTGVAFGLFPSHGDPGGTVLLSLLGGCALCVVVLFFVRTPDSERRLLISLACVLGGALGNLTDRVVRGAVTDFIDLYVGERHWPTFNIADSAITVGITLLALEIVKVPGDRARSSDAGSTSGEQAA